MAAPPPPQNIHPLPPMQLHPHQMHQQPPPYEMPLQHQNQPTYYELKSRTVPPHNSPPTFKTLTPTSRTQLKQQLMREQFHEQHRRESLQQQAQSQTQLTLNKPRRQEVLTIPTTVTNTSVHSSVEVPPQVLQVRTVLENPTRYHVIQKQRSQVRQYLSESFQPRQEGIPRPTGGAVLSAPELPLPAPSPDYDFASGSGVLSPVTTSNSETDDFLDDILSLESGTTGLGTSSSLLSAGDVDSSGEMSAVKQESLPLSDVEIHAMAKDRQKKDNHNMIERRRRFNINDRIKELGTLLPKTNDPFYEVIRDVRPNKGTILKSSVDYIKCLREEVNKLKQSEIRRRQMEVHNRKLLLRIQELERQAKLHGLPVNDFAWQPSQDSQMPSGNTSPHPPYSAPVSNRVHIPHQSEPVCQSVDSNMQPTTTMSEASTDPLDSLRLDQFAPAPNLGCLQLDSGANDVMASIPVSFLDTPIKVTPSSTSTLMMSGQDLNTSESTSVLSLSQMEDLMEDDPHNPVVQGDPMLCSSPSSRMCLGRDDDHQRATIDSMLADDSTAMLGINSSTGGASLLGDSTSNQVLSLSLLGSTGLLSTSSLLGSSGLLGPSRARTNHISDCFSDTDMELGA
ncbi:transcription factor Mitf isoform X1 [Arctopsyche grandis]|uniref:transcription factor Mitf isoform X1 n=1 Tax=Arctopsyche grandis TaxID=121162 RepID=UPI00406D65A5